MGAKLGIVGLPNAGKSTLFNALTRGKAPVAPYPFTTTDRNVGIAAVDDPRLETLATLIPHDKIIPTSIEFVDIAGLIRGAHQGEGLGNQFLSHIFAVDAILHMVRCFEDANIPHSAGQVDPAQDVEIIDTELLLKDLEILQRRMEKERKLARSGDKAAQALVSRLERWKEALGQGTPLRKLSLSDAEHPRASGLDLLSGKPIIYLANLGEDAVRTPPPSAKSPQGIQRLQAIADEEHAPLIPLCAKLEAELAELEPADRDAMRRELGLADSALPRVVQASYQRLGLVTFFTTVSRIIQAWTVARGTRAPQAAGTIHTDFERQFIRADVISIEELAACGGDAQARAQGRLRVEGKDYVIQDGDVVHFRIGQ